MENRMLALAIENARRDYTNAKRREYTARRTWKIDVSCVKYEYALNAAIDEREHAFKTLQALIDEKDSRVE